MIERILERFSEAKKDKDIRNDNVTDYWSYTRGIYVCEEIVQEVAKEYGNGWIPCEVKMPEKGHYVEVTYRTKYGTITTWLGVFCGNKNQGDIWVIDGSKVACKDVLAWKEKTPPYQKGEPHE